MLADGIAATRLESRALTAPMFWRLPVGSLLNPLPGETATADVTGNSASNTTNSGGTASGATDNTFTADGYAAAGGKSTDTENTTINSFTNTGMVTTSVNTNYELDGMATSQIVDLAPPAMGGQPVGIPQVVINTVDQVNLIATGNAPNALPGNNTMTVTSAGTRSYQLANVNASDNPNPMLVQHFHAHYDAPATTPLAVVGANVSSSTGFSPALVITDGLVNLTFKDRSGSGSFTNTVNGATDTYTYSISTTSFDYDVTETEALSSLPVQTGDTSTQVGPVLTITYNAAINTGNQVTAQGVSDMATLTMKYDAHMA